MKKSYCDHVALIATGKHICVDFNKIFPTNYIVTLGIINHSNLVPDIKYGGEFNPGQLMINARLETAKDTF